MKQETKSSTREIEPDAFMSTKRQQPEAWLTRLFVKLNCARARELVPELTALTRQEKIDKALRFFDQLQSQELSNELKPSRQWSFEYFQACALGSEARRQFLVDEGVFADGKHLICPSRVIPQMEILNLNPLNYAGPLRDEVEEMARLTFFEFFGVKNLLSFPELSDIIATLAPFIPPLRHIPLPRPHLKLSLLLKDYVDRILLETKRVDGLPLIAIFGPGKGEELVPLLDKGLSILCFDTYNASILRNYFTSTFSQAGVPTPEMVTIGEGANIESTFLNTWKMQDYPPTIFICSNVDFSEDEAIPEKLQMLSRVSASIYVLHEMYRKAALFSNMARAVKGAVIVFDGYPSCAPFDSMLLPVTNHTEALIAGHDAVISQLLCPLPEEMQRIAEESVPQLSWESLVVGPPIPAPLFYKQQAAVIGRYT